MIEQWVPALGYEGRYEVSTRGRVRSVDRAEINSLGHSRTLRGRILKPHTLENGYLQVSLGRRCNRSVHVIVAESFIGPRPDGLVACHNNGDQVDNRPDNLRWDTQSSNVLDAVAQGTYRHWCTDKTECVNGHEFTPENTYRDRKGNRECRTCRADHQRRFRARRMAAA